MKNDRISSSITNEILCDDGVCVRVCEVRFGVRLRTSHFFVHRNGNRGNFFLIIFLGKF